MREGLAHPEFKLAAGLFADEAPLVLLLCLALISPVPALQVGRAALLTRPSSSLLGYCTLLQGL